MITSLLWLSHKVQAAEKSLPLGSSPLLSAGLLYSLHGEALVIRQGELELVMSCCIAIRGFALIPVACALKVSLDLYAGRGHETELTIKENAAIKDSKLSIFLRG